MTIQSRLSVVGKINRRYKTLKNQNAELLTEENKTRNLQVKDAVYQVEPWINIGLIKPEEKLIEDAKYLHDVCMYH